MKEKLKIYDPIFKEKAIQLSYERGNVSRVEKELKITRSLLFSWRKEYQKFGNASFPGTGKLKLNPEQEQIHKLEKKLKELELKFEILKKGNKYLFQDRLSLYQFIDSNKKIYSINNMCKALGVSHITYYRWKKQIIPKTEIRIILIKQEITSIFFEFKERYGSPRITKELQKRGYKIECTRVAKYMRQLGLRSMVIKKNKVQINSEFNVYAPNILDEKYIATQPSKVWISAITYIKTTKGYLYITIILDLFDHKIIGWSLGDGLTAKETVLVAWEMAVSNREITNKLIFHSTRGAQYASRSFTKILNSHTSITRSMSNQGDYLDNAIARDFFNQLKKEFACRNKRLTKNEMRGKIFEYIETWNNEKDCILL
ncbi:IS3 family transposase [Flavobacterium zhairuonense]|uniref:IS3 family transposase n=1 Tax=Flavobacterium zhairuonense TaxID=2493631 RepID=UPI00104E82B7|nr:IS3 family transposase [Flavobacterium zhairuonense]KAF2512820.1 IS3 family transposase [Flavobacterium zhairuonense]